MGFRTDDGGGDEVLAEEGDAGTPSQPGDFYFEKIGGAVEDCEVYLFEHEAGRVDVRLRMSNLFLVLTGFILRLLLLGLLFQRAGL